MLYGGRGLSMQIERKAMTAGFWDQCIPYDHFKLLDSHRSYVFPTSRDLSESSITFETDIGNLVHLDGKMFLLPKWMDDVLSQIAGALGLVRAFWEISRLIGFSSSIPGRPQKHQHITMVIVNNYWSYNHVWGFLREIMYCYETLTSIHTYNELL